MSEIEVVFRAYSIEHGREVDFRAIYEIEYNFNYFPAEFYRLKPGTLELLKPQDDKKEGDEHG